MASMSSSTDVHEEASTPTVDDTVTLNSLVSLRFIAEDGTRKPLHLIDRVASNWRILGDALNVEGYDIANIGKNNSTVQDCCRDVVSHWLNGTEPKTWRRLMEALVYAKFGREADVLEVVLQSPNEQSANVVPEANTIDGASSTVVTTVPSLEQNTCLQLIPDMRGYQEELATPGLQGDSYIICAPTGSGKTLVAARIIEDHITKKRMLGGEGKIVFMVQTRHLAHQQKKQLEKWIEGIRVEHVVGAINNEEENDDIASIATLLPNMDVVVCTAGKLAAELKTNKLSVNQITLLVVDECHHTTGHTSYSECLEILLRAKMNENENIKIPQVVGLTASPGAGKGNSPSLTKAITHQFNLCAHLNASGIKTVTENLEELLKHSNKPEGELQDILPRDQDAVHDAVSTAMAELESMIGVTAPVKQNLPKYHPWVKGLIRMAEISKDPKERDQLSVLRNLYQYYLALTTYEDFTLDDAMDVLTSKELRPPPEEKATELEKTLASKHSDLLSLLPTLPKTDNPVLEQVADILVKQFTSKPDSKGIFFVCEIRHTQYVQRWIETHPELKGLNIQVKSIIGDKKAGMTKDQQLAVLDSFRQGDCNLLVSTSVLEEGIDVPSCNFVIRFQVVSSEIGEIQARGRAREQKSKMYTIMSSSKQIQLVNEERERLALKAVESVTNLCKQPNLISNKQKELLRSIDEERRVFALGKKRWNTTDVKLICKSCKTHICCGDDVFIFKSHYVVPGEAFFEKIDVYPHPRRKTIGEDDYSHKIACKNCSNDLGVLITTQSTQRKLPVITCKYFSFSYPGLPTNEIFKQWSKVPFAIQPFSEFENELS